MSIAWMCQTIDRFIGECRLPPLLPEFRDAMVVAREHNWEREKRQNAKDAQEFMETHFGQEEIHHMFSVFRSRLKDGISDEHYAAETKLINEAVQGLQRSKKR